MSILILVARYCVPVLLFLVVLCFYTAKFLAFGTRQVEPQDDEERV